MGWGTFATEIPQAHQSRGGKGKTGKRSHVQSPLHVPSTPREHRSLGKAHRRDYNGRVTPRSSSAQETTRNPAAHRPSSYPRFLTTLYGNIEKIVWGTHGRTQTKCTGYACFSIRMRYSTKNRCHSGRKVCAVLRRSIAKMWLAYMESHPSSHARG